MTRSGEVMSKPVLTTPLCKFLGIDYPILLAGMGSLSFAPCTPPSLVAAVSEAGGMGVLGTSTMGPDELRENIREIRRLTGRPFGVDIIIPNVTASGDTVKRSELREHIRTRYPDHWKFVDRLRGELGLPDAQVGDEWAVNTKKMQEQLVEVILEENVALFAAALGVPDWVLPRARAQGMKVLALTGNVRHAQRQKEAGVDFIVATGTEGGGHTGRIGTMALIPQVVDAVSPMPVVAGGGIGDGRAVAAALALGAVGVWVGTAFLASEESMIGDRAKQLLLKADASAADVHTLYTGKPMRSLKNGATRAWLESGLPTLPLPYQKVLMDDVQYAAGIAGRVDIEANPCGQIVGMIGSVRPAAKIMLDLVQGAVENVESLRKMITLR